MNRAAAFSARPLATSPTSSALPGFSSSLWRRGRSSSTRSRAPSASASSSPGEGGPLGAAGPMRVVRSSILWRASVSLGRRGTTLSAASGDRRETLSCTAVATDPSMSRTSSVARRPRTGALWSLMRYSASSHSWEESNAWDLEPSCSRFSRRCQRKLPSRNRRSSSEARSSGEGSVSSRWAMYGYALASTLYRGSAPMASPSSTVSDRRMRA
mmetsp:Transcript_15577/g.44186  ORF Transcript_15577/g.44186 Transcript_15577/m.44186 type:complete len:213 (-) Transcript_15577:1270-1908(-)